MVGKPSPTLQIVHDMEENQAAADELKKLATAMPCAYCGVMMNYSSLATTPTRDHIWPKHERSITEGRIGKIWCCQACNIAKGDMMPAEWLAVLKTRYVVLGHKEERELCNAAEILAHSPRAMKILVNSQLRHSACTSSKTRAMRTARVYAALTELMSPPKRD